MAFSYWWQENDVRDVAVVRMVAKYSYQCQENDKRPLVVVSQSKLTTAKIGVQLPEGSYRIVLKLKRNRALPDIPLCIQFNSKRCDYPN